MPAGRRGQGNASSNKDVSKQFNDYFASIYGKSRWKALSKCLAAATSHVALFNSTAGITPEALQQTEQLLPYVSHGFIECFRRAQDAGSYSPPSADPCTGLATHYWMDLASVLPPLLLAPAPGHKVLDMCAAPGGKTLVLAQQLFSNMAQAAATAQPLSEGQVLPSAAAPSSSTAIAGTLSEGQNDETAGEAVSSAAPENDNHEVMQNADDDADSVVGDVHSSDQHSNTPVIPDSLLSGYLSQRSQLTANEIDRGRCTRLEGVLKQYLPLSLLSAAEGHAAVRVTCQAADKYWQRNEAEVYDRVLLDVPCSSDRHVVQQASAQRGVITEAQWSERGCNQLAALQLQLLLAGLRALAPGGLLVYSTCSLAPVENDLVIKQALNRQPAGAVQVQLPLQQGGWAMTPDQLRDIFGAEPTSYGMLIAPDVKGTGPMYVCVLRKTQSTANLGYAARFGLMTLNGPTDDGSEDDASSQDSEQLAGH